MYRRHWIPHCLLVEVSRFSYLNVSTTRIDSVYVGDLAEHSLYVQARVLASLISLEFFL